MGTIRVTYGQIISKTALILKPESSFYIISIIYGIGVSVLTLAIPISVQSLVSTITFGVLVQPLVVLTVVLLGLLLFSGVLNVLQTYIIELFQRHFYARTTSDIAIKLLNSDYAELKKSNGVELVNRYFDVMTVQKSVSTLLTGGIAIILQTGVGLLLLAFYHPYFLAFDILLIILLWLVWTLFGKKALETAVGESKAKYKVASWLEEIARASLFFKTRMRKAQALHISDDFICGYLKDRSSHFRQVFFQNILLLGIYALMSALILGLGGYLVIDGQLTLGQLVAAELIVTVILASFSKSAKYFESFYDLYAAIDKLSHFYDLPMEKSDVEVKPKFNGYDLSFDNVIFKTDRYAFSYNFNFEQGRNYFANSKFFSSRLIFADLVNNLTKPENGKIYFGGVPYKNISALDIRDRIFTIDEPVVLDGSITKNLKLGRKDISDSEVNDALKLVDLGHLKDVFDNGLEQRMLPTGYPLWSSQLVRFEIARAIVHKPKVLILTEVFDQVEDERRVKIINHLMKSRITLILFSNKAVMHPDFDSYLAFHRDQIIEFKKPDDFSRVIAHD